MEELIRYLASFLGGGIVVALLNWWRLSRAASREHEIQWLEEQLRSLYGPLHYFCSQNGALFDLSRQLMGALNEVFGGVKWSDAEGTQARLHSDMEYTIGLSNSYVQRAVENNSRVIELLEKNWHLADVDDVPILAQFQVDHTRLQTEVDRESGLKTPLLVFEKLGKISYMRPEMIAAIKAKTEAKQVRLAKLRG